MNQSTEGLPSDDSGRIFADSVSTDTTHQENGGEAAADRQSPEEEEGMGREWALQDKHFFILSDAGKPIYSRYAQKVHPHPLLLNLPISSCHCQSNPFAAPHRHGDEQKLCGLMGVMQGIFSFVSSSGDEIRFQQDPRDCVAFNNNNNNLVF